MSQSRIVALTRQHHATLTYKALDDYSFAAGMTVMPLLAFEVPEAARCFPIIFPHPRSAAPHALLGLGDKNVFVDEQGRWTASYLPLMAANHPFSLMEARFKDGEGEPEATELALAIEEDAPHFRQEDGLPLYGPDGEPMELLQRVTAVLGQQYRRHRESEKSLAELTLSGLVRERVVTVRSGDATRAVRGLRVADRDKVMALPDASLARWAKNGLLEMLYAHWQSMRHLSILLDDPSCPQKVTRAAG